MTTDNNAPLFSSDRERRLWILTAAVVVGIYSTLGLARKLAGVLLERELLDASFLAGMLLIGIAIVLQALRKRPGGAEIGVALAIIAVYLMTFLRMAIPEERSHLIEYTVVALFIYEALCERVNQGRTVRTPALVAVLATTLIGTVDEGIQIFLPSRVFDPRDILFNILAAVLAVGASVALTWARRQNTRR